MDINQEWQSKNHHVIAFAKKYLKKCDERSEESVRIAVIEQTENLYIKITFKKHRIVTVMPGVFNYEYRFSSVEIQSNLKIIRCSN